jgi:hypothetical protein
MVRVKVTAGGLSGTAVGGEVRELMAATGDDVIDPHFEPEMTGMTPDEYAAMMRAGGRPIEGNRSIKGRY